MYRYTVTYRNGEHTVITSTFPTLWQHIRNKHLVCGGTDADAEDEYYEVKTYEKEASVDGEYDDSGRYFIGTAT